MSSSILRLFIITFLFFGGWNIIVAQDNVPVPQRTQTQAPTGQGFDKSRLEFGGSLGLSFGSQSTFIDLSPTVGYRVTDNFTAGLGPVFNYISQEFIGIGREKFIITGGRLFSRYIVFENLFLMGEYNMLSYKEPFADRRLVHRLPLGGGYRQGAGRGNVYIMIMYDLLHENNNTVLNPLIFNVGFGIGL